MCLGSCLLDSGSCGSNWARMIDWHPHGTYPPVDPLWVTSHGRVKSNHSARRCVDKEKTNHVFHGSQLTTGLGLVHWGSKLAPFDTISQREKSLKNQDLPTLKGHFIPETGPCFLPSTPGWFCIKALPYQTQ